MISAVVITLNEEDNIARCIEGLRRVTDDIVIMDTGSTDKTVAIAEELKVSVFTTPWLGYGPTKNHAVSFARYPWILSIDADEVVTESLAKEIKELSLNPKEIYAINILTNYCGTWIKYSGWFPSYKKRIYHRDYVAWDDRKVHENLLMPDDTKVVRLRALLLHYSYKTPDDHFIKGKRYARQGAEELIRKGKRVSIFKILFGPSFRFFRMYILKLGIFDGIAGFNLARREARMVRWRYEIYNQLKKDEIF